MTSQQSGKEKPQGLPNPYGGRGLPNPYAAAAAAQAGGARFFDEQAKADQKKTAFHNPHQIKRPQARGGSVKKPAIPRAAMAMSTTSSSSDPAPADATAPSNQLGLDFWTSTADDDAATLEWKREQDRMRRQEQKEQKKLTKQYGWWKGDTQYKVDKWTNMKAYMARGGYGRTLHSFADYLEAQARSHNASSEQSSDAPSASDTTPDPAMTAPNGPPTRSEQSPDVPSTSSAAPAPATTAPKYRFAPPASYDNDDRTSKSPVVSDTQSEEAPYARRLSLSQPSAAAPSPPPAASAPYAAVPPPPPSTEAPASAPPPPPPASAPYNPTISAPPVHYSPTISAPPVHYSPTISAAPVRYNLADKTGASAREERPAKRVKMSIAESMMAKMGYVKGQGLGKNNDGITTHLEVKARKKDKKQVDIFEDIDDEKNSIKSQQVFDILGGRTTKRKEPDRFGQESKVIVAWGLVDDIDWSADADRNDGGVRQEMGQTFDEKFGRIERIHVNLASESKPVYIKFASELSALNAVNRFHEGYQFRGRNIRALYYNEAKFEASIFDH